VREQFCVDLSVYVHFPWCLRKCPYCDFATSALEREAIPHGAYADAVLAELGQRSASLEHARLFSVFFGGGTPSLWEPSELARVVAGIRAAFKQQVDDVEVTVECNPSSLDAERARALHDAGVNRLSVGVQSLDDAELKFLGRLHDRSLAMRALDAAQAVFTRVSADLMFALPEQPEARFYGYLDELFARGLSHVSAYALTIEPATKFGELSRKGLLQAAPDDSYAAMFEGIHQRCAAQGLGHYEVSNYARSGEESRHNQHYWRGGSYLGLGAAAVGCLHGALLGSEANATKGRRYRNHPDAQRYMQRAFMLGSRADPHASAPEVEVFKEALSAADVIREALMLGLRTREGVDLAQLRERVGTDPRSGRERVLERLLSRAQLKLENERLSVPVERWLLLDGIVAELF
jgi:putative oxygen-independent coproporphyrinogen III oxidase